jgi:hypothetical protein
MVILSGLSVPLMAQTPFKPAPVVEIFRESIKEGRGAAHEKVETEFAAAFRKANFPAHYVALASISGPGEVWFIQPMASFAISEEYDKAEEKEPLKSAIAMMDSRDGELRSSSRTLWAVHRPDLSYGIDHCNVAKARVVTVGTYRVRLGRDDDFAAGGKQLLDTYAKANIQACLLGYQVVAGAPSGTYLFFGLMESMKDLDGEPERMQKLQNAMGKENFAKFMRGTGDIFISMDEAMFQVKPGMSYPPQSYVDADPAFWKPKAAPKPAATAAAPAAEKKAAQ